MTVKEVITAHDRSNHNSYGYTFFVKGQSYTGWESPRHAEPVVGKEVTVYYDPLNPEKNALTDFDELSSSSLGPAPVLLLGIGTGAVFIFIRRQQFKRETAGKIT